MHFEFFVYHHLPYIHDKVSALCFAQVHRRLGPRNSDLQGFNLICIDPLSKFISSIIWNMIRIKVEIKGKHNFASWNVSMNIINNESFIFLTN